MLVKIKNNQIVSFNLPEVGTLNNGATVSGYNLLPLETLREEGWVDLIDNPPAYNTETHRLVHNGYDVSIDCVTVLYSVEEIIPEPPKPYVPTIEERLEAAEAALLAMMEV